MSKAKLSPLIIIMIVVLIGTMAGMAYEILRDGAAALTNTGLLFAVAGIVVIAVIATLLIRDTRRQLIEQAAQNERGSG